MGGIYKSTSHLYFYYVIKKKLKKHYLTQSKELYYDVDLGDVITVGGSLTMNEDLYPTHQFEDIEYANLIGRQERIALDAADRITNRMHQRCVIGTVIWNQELHRLEFWDGYVWQHLVTDNIV